MGTMKQYKNWLEHPYFDEPTKSELAAIANNHKEIEDRFYRDLEFGTGGLRGLIGAGTNRMNRYVVRKTSQGLANFLKNQKSTALSIAIAYDSRHKSREFAEESARVFTRNGIKTYLFDELKPTPELSFAVRHLHCNAGIVITASHNPKEYNGYKVYGEDGGQLPLELSNAVLAEVDAISDITTIQVMELDKAKATGLLVMIGQQVDDAYMTALKSLSVTRLDQDINYPIIYTPIHGSGNKPVRRILKEVGFNHVYVVPQQELPDPDFSTVKYPNPEERAVFELAIEMARQKDAEMIIGTDPDCDRIGVVVRNRDGQYATLSGNQTGCLMMEFILNNLQQQGRLPSNGFVVKTIVTTELARAIAKAYQVKLIEVLTGFKFIGEQILLREDRGNEKYLFGFEESYGYLAGTFARDKDAVVAAMLIAQMFAWYKSRGMTLDDGMTELYEKYGFAREGLDSFTLKGKDGLEKIQQAMSLLRQKKAELFGNIGIKAVRDYECGIRTVVETGKEEPTGLPESNVLYYETVNDFWFCVRPSGTEPKIKIYYGVTGQTLMESEKALELLKNQVLSVLKPLLTE